MKCGPRFPLLLKRETGLVALQGECILKYVHELVPGFADPHERNYRVQVLCERRVTDFVGEPLVVLVGASAGSADWVPPFELFDNSWGEPTVDDVSGVCADYLRRVDRSSAPVPPF